MQDDITTVFNVLEEVQRPAAGKKKKRWVNADTVALAVVLLSLAGAVLADRTGYADATLVLVSIFLVTPVLYTVYQIAVTARHLYPLLRAPTRHTVSQAVSRVEQRRQAILRLRGMPRELLNSAEQALAAEIEGLESRMSLIVGVLEKTGMVPAAIALYLGYVQYVKNGTPSDLLDVLFLSALMLYIAAFFGLAWKQSLKDRLWLLQQINRID